MFIANAAISSGPLTWASAARSAPSVTTARPGSREIHEVRLPVQKVVVTRGRVKSDGTSRVVGRDDLSGLPVTSRTAPEI